MRLFHGRCEEVLPDLAGVQLTVTSPPYNQLGSRIPEVTTGGFGAQALASWAANIRAIGYDDDLPEAEYREAQVVVAKLVAEASTPDAAYFYNHKVRWRDGVCLHPLRMVDDFAGWALRSEVVWDRRAGITMNARMYHPTDERLYWLVRDPGNFQWHQRAVGWGTVWRCPPSRATDWHPCPYPVLIPERAMLTATSRGDLVLDPYAGSGTTLRVAIALGRRAVGIEAHEPYCEAMAAMLDAM